MNIFSYDSAHKNLELNEPAILLIKEFKKLYDRDKTKNKSRAFKEFTFIYLAIDWKSPYNLYTAQERHEEAMCDSGLTEEEFNNPDFREAIRKYRTLQNSSKSIQLLEAARQAADLFITYFKNIVNLSERDKDGKPIFPAEKVMKEMANLHKVHEELVILEDEVKKEQEMRTDTRGDVQIGFEYEDSNTK